jgi:putative nucleotidyltransferase with HDIG domain
MTRIKQFVFHNFEALIILSIFLGVLLMNYFVVQKAAFLNFYYLPALIAGFALGRRMAILASVLSVAFVTMFATVLSHGRIAIGADHADTMYTILLWGCFLVLSSYLVGTLHERSEERTRQLRHAYVGVLEILSRYIEANDRYTLGHSMRVSQTAVEVAHAMELDARRVENCRVAGLLHDIGKVEISMDLIRKAAGLTEEEKRVVATHAARGARMIDSLGGVLSDVVPIIEQHHTWYRDHLSGKAQVPLEAFIIAVADCYDAIVTDRPYRAGKPPYKALEELEAGSGTQFSPEVLKAFRQVVGRLVAMDEAATDLGVRDLGVPVGV